VAVWGPRYHGLLGLQGHVCGHQGSTLWCKRLGQAVLEPHGVALKQHAPFAGGQCCLCLCQERGRHLCMRGILRQICVSPGSTKCKTLSKVVPRVLVGRRLQCALHAVRAPQYHTLSDVQEGHSWGQAALASSSKVPKSLHILQPPTGSSLLNSISLCRKMQRALASSQFPGWGSFCEITPGCQKSALSDKKNKK